MKPTKNSEKEKSQDIGNPYRMKPNLMNTNRSFDAAFSSVFGGNGGGYSKKPAPAPKMPEGDMHYDRGDKSD